MISNQFIESVINETVNINQQFSKDEISILMMVSRSGLRKFICNNLNVSQSDSDEIINTHNDRYNLLLSKIPNLIDILNHIIQIPPDYVQQYIDYPILVHGIIVDSDGHNRYVLDINNILRVGFNVVGYSKKYSTYYTYRDYTYFLYGRKYMVVKEDIIARVVDVNYTTNYGLSLSDDYDFDDVYDITDIPNFSIEQAQKLLTNNESLFEKVYSPHLIKMYSAYV